MSWGVQRVAKPRIERRRAELLTTGIGASFTAILPAWGVLHVAEAILVGWSVAFIVGYWLPPRPQESYVRWVLESITLVIGFYLAFFKAPLWLKESIPTLLAYSVPILTFGILSIFLLGKTRHSSHKVGT
jgi:drug/metabolite transporter (DMT)-like permease